jgi:hypothetical protein
MGYLITRLNILALMTAVLSCFLVFSSGYAHEHSDQVPADAKLGAVSFEISCKAELQPDFNRAVALLHSFWHSEAPAVDSAMSSRIAELYRLADSPLSMAQPRY